MRSGIALHSREPGAPLPHEDMRNHRNHREDQEAPDEDRMEFLQAFGGFMNQALPVVQNAPQMAPMMMEIMKFGVGAFKQAKQLEGVLDQAVQQYQQSQGQQGPSAEQQQAQAEQQMEQAKLQAQMQLEQELPVDFKQLWLQTLLFKKNQRINVNPWSKDNKELLNYTVVSTGQRYTLTYQFPYYAIDNQQYTRYDDALAYMWSTISK